MTQIVVAQRMWQRRGTAAEWAFKNPILEAGEIGIELGDTPLDPQKVKVGNGVAPWLDLDYIAGGEGGYLELRAFGGYIQYRTSEDGDWIDVIDMAQLKGDQGPPGEGSFATMGATFSVQATGVGVSAPVRVSCDADITGWTILVRPGQVGSAVIDVRRCAFADYPDGLTSICAGSKPSLTGSNKAQDQILTGWSTDVQSGDCYAFVLESAAGLTDITLTLDVIKRDPE